MCILVISDYCGTVEKTSLTNLSSQIGDLINGARINQRAIAFLQRKDGEGLSGLGLRIGRYEPVFAMRDAGEQLPMALTDFIARNAASSIDLAGIASMASFHRLREIFERSGYCANINSDATLVLFEGTEGQPRNRTDAAQLSGNEPLKWGAVDDFASMKNHSTRCPRA